MKNVIIYTLIFSFIISCVISYIYYDVTRIYNKKLIKNSSLILIVHNQAVPIDASILKDIIDDRNNKWTFTIATYAYDTYIKSQDNNINFRFTGDHLVVNYKSKKYGYIQLISQKPFIALENKLKITN